MLQPPPQWHSRHLRSGNSVRPASFEAGVQNAVAQLAAHQAHNELAQEFLVFLLASLAELRVATPHATRR